MNPETTSCEVVHALLKACPSMASIANKEGLYPLHKACWHCPDENVIKVLLEEYPYALQNPIKVTRGMTTFLSILLPFMDAVMVWLCCS